MKKILSLILCLIVLLVVAPLLCAQDLSEYRSFSFGMNLTTVLKHTDQTISDVKAIHQHPALIQEVTWRPPNLPGPSFQTDTVEQILFSFYNGALYKISATYDRNSTEGLTAQDMIKAIAAKYGPATSVVPEIGPVANEQFDMKPKPVASWEDSQYSFNLVRSSFSGAFELVIFSKRAQADAAVAIAEAVKWEEQQVPQREAERQKKETDDLAVARLKNQKAFRP
jgi:hypothetical protein